MSNAKKTIGISFATQYLELVIQFLGVLVLARILQPEEIVVSRRFSASVEPLQTTALAFKLGGTVQSLYRPPGLKRDVQVGDVLAKGAVIAELDEGDLRRAKTAAAAKLDEARFKDDADLRD